MATTKKDSGKPTTITVDFALERVTKNTYRFAETGDENVVGTLYLAKRLFDAEPTGVSIVINLTK